MTMTTLPKINNIIFFIKISTATHFKTAHMKTLLLLFFYAKSMDGLPR